MYAGPHRRQNWITFFQSRSLCDTGLVSNVFEHLHRQTCEHDRPEPLGSTFNTVTLNYIIALCRLFGSVRSVRTESKIKMEKGSVSFCTALREAGQMTLSKVILWQLWLWCITIECFQTQKTMWTVWTSVNPIHSLYQWGLVVVVKRPLSALLHTVTDSSLVGAARKRAQSHIVLSFLAPRVGY